MKEPGRSPAPASYFNKSMWQVGAIHHTTKGRLAIPALQSPAANQRRSVPSGDGTFKAPALPGPYLYAAAAPFGVAAVCLSVV